MGSRVFSGEGESLVFLLVVGFILIWFVECMVFILVFVGFYFDLGLIWVDRAVIGFCLVGIL